jgi:DNA-binding NarL/FixJ family response regulator
MDDVLSHQDSSFDLLTPRERDVLRYVAYGKPNKIIAAELGVSQRTVEAHRARGFQKLQVRNAVELVHRMIAPRAGKASQLGAAKTLSH